MTYAPGQGTLLKLYYSSAYNTVAQVTKLTPPSSEMGTVETTIITDSVRTFLATIRDSGEAQFTIEWDSADASHAQLWTVHRSGALSDWKITFNDVGDTDATFSGILTKFPWDEVDVESVITIPITIKVSGDITVTP